MGVDLKDLIIKHPIELSNLRGKRLAIDTFNMLYQFLAGMRQRDGKPLMDAQGNVTSHLSGIFSRTTKFLEQGIQPVFVFDGAAPLEKQGTQESRREIREEAQKKYDKAVAEGNEEEARKFGQQTSKLTQAMIHETKELLTAIGVPWVQAMGEGEAQAAYMANKGHVWAAVSQDYDAILFGTTRLVRNLSVSGKRKVPNTNIYQEVKPEVIDLPETLNFHALDISSIIKIALLIGTDYNPKGVQGIGPKSALKVIKEGRFADYQDRVPNWEKLQNIFLKPVITKDYNLEWTAPNPEKIREILIGRHQFGEQRVNSTIDKLMNAHSGGTQQGLDMFT